MTFLSCLNTLFLHDPTPLKVSISQMTPICTFPHDTGADVQLLLRTYHMPALLKHFPYLVSSDLFNKRRRVVLCSSFHFMEHREIQQLAQVHTALNPTYAATTALLSFRTPPPREPSFAPKSTCPKWKSYSFPTLYF